MREAGISGLVRRKRGRTTIRVPGVRVADDLVERQFRPAAPERALGRRHHLPAHLGGLALPRRRPGRLQPRGSSAGAMADHMRAELVVDALQMAVARRRPAPGLIHHSDQGSQYVSLAFGQAARDAGIARSMGSKGDCLRQRRRRELLRHAQEGARPPPLLADPPRARPARSSSTSRRSTTAPAGTRRSACSPPPTSKPPPHHARARARKIRTTCSQPCGLRTATTTTTTRLHTKAPTCPDERGNSTGVPAGTSACACRPKRASCQCRPRCSRPPGCGRVRARAADGSHRSTGAGIQGPG